MVKKTREEDYMRICTVNVPESYIEALKRLTEAEGMYPSRSEAVRYAVHDLIKKELRLAKSIANHEKEVKELITKNLVKVPINGENEPIREYKTYKILRRLEY